MPPPRRESTRLDLISLSSALLTVRYTMLPARLVASAAIGLAGARSALAYANALARYDLRRSRLRSSKVGATGHEVVGAVEAEAHAQRARRAHMVWAWLDARAGPGSADGGPAGGAAGGPTVESVRRELVQMVAEWTGSDVPVEVDVDDAIEELERLGLVERRRDGEGHLTMPMRGAGGATQVLEAHLGAVLRAAG
jgi:hypothetical protein